MSTASDLSASRSRRERPGSHSQMGELAEDPVVRNYVLIALAAVVVLLVVLLYQGLGTGSLVPALVGIMGVVTRWRSAPVLVLLALAGLYYIEMLRFFGTVRPPGLDTAELADVLLAGAVLIYAAAHYRLQGLVHEIVPRESKKAGQPVVRVAGELSPRRSTAAVPQSEFALTAFIPGWAAAALALWLTLPTAVPYLGTYVELRPQDWQAGLLVWVVGVALLVLTSVMQYVGYRRMSEAEARLFLQDAVWRETRREQRRINRWLAWARLRRQRREEAK